MPGHKPPCIALHFDHSIRVGATACRLRFSQGPEALCVVAESVHGCVDATEADRGPSAEVAGEVLNGADASVQDGVEGVGHGFVETVLMGTRVMQGLGMVGIWG